MSKTNKEKSNSDVDTYKSISISEKNKLELESIMRKLEQHYEKSLRIDVALGHILSVYNLIKSPKKYYDLITL